VPSTLQVTLRLEKTSETAAAPTSLNTARDPTRLIASSRLAMGMPCSYKALFLTRKSWAVSDASVLAQSVMLLSPVDGSRSNLPSFPNTCGDGGK